MMLGWKGLPGTNTVDREKFYKIGPDSGFISYSFIHFETAAIDLHGQPSQQKFKVKF